MRVFLLPSTFTCSNMGDVAMLQCACRRLAESWPGTIVTVPTREPEALRRFCPEVTPAPYRDWFADRYLLGHLHKIAPGPLRSAIALKKLLRRVFPSAESLAIRLKHLSQPGELKAFDAYRHALRSADLIAMAGAGGIGDVFPLWSSWAVQTLRGGLRRGQPIVILGHGFGAVTRHELRREASLVLRKVDLIALREARIGPSLLHDFEVPSDRILVTGDDAIESSYLDRAPTLGDQIGISLRQGTLTGISENAIGPLRPALKEFARMQSAEFQPLPISRDQLIDSRSIRELVGDRDTSDSGESLDTPEKVIAHVRRCKIVVTATYHAGVFALAQGIPAICLAKSAYFAGKFHGLAGQFGAGCQVIEIDQPDAAAKFAIALQQQWERAAFLRPGLLDAAVKQIQISRFAYRRTRDIASLRKHARA